MRRRRGEPRRKSYLELEYEYYQQQKTRNQRNREREQTFFIILTSLWIVGMVALILYKAVTG